MQIHICNEEPPKCSRKQPLPPFLNMHFKPKQDLNERGNMHRNPHSFAIVKFSDLARSSRK